MSEIKTSRLSRIAKLGTSLMKVGADLAMDKVKNVRKDVNDATHRISAAKEIIESMGQLKGGLMKIGQMISITEDLLLPPEIVSLFESLQKHAPPMSEQQMLSVFQEEFGKLPEEVFAYFNRVPMASASIGQVHHAMTIDGEKVAVKIQYPKIVKAITGDLKNLDQIDKLFSLLLPGKPHIRPMLEEIKESLVEECDYQHEMARMVLFRDIYANSFPDIHVPKTYPELSTSRVLTTEYIHGDPFEETLHYPQEVKDKLGSMLYNSFLYSLFEKGAPSH
jgi:aarF domain-containing kinase